jgi:hypothetical protein
MPVHHANVNVELQMADADVLGEDNNHIFKGELPSRQSFRCGDECASPVGEVGPAQVTFGDRVIPPRKLAVGVVEDRDVGSGLPARGDFI